jgi:AcrR family transcriptional regulator
MKEKPFKKITVQEIAGKAKLDRRTFYRNFSSKEDILVFQIQRLGANYIEIFKQEETLSFSFLLEKFCHLAYQNKDFILSLIENDFLNLILTESEKLFQPIYDEYKNKFPQKIDIQDIDYSIVYHTAGYWNVIIKWLKDPNEKSPSEIARIITYYTERMLS